MLLGSPRWPAGRAGRDERRVDGPGRTKQIGGTRRAGAASSFTLPEEAPAGRPAAVAPSSAAYDVAALMALQSVEGPGERHRKAIRRGFELLDSPEGIRLDLLAGDVSPERLETLVGLIGQQAPTDDPRVEALIADIELRARVELAKRGRYET